MADQPGNKPMPTIEERLEAMAMNLEIAVAMQQANEKAIAALGDKVDKVVDAVNRLARIAGADEQRLGEAELSLDAILDRLEKIERNRNGETKP